MVETITYAFCALTAAVILLCASGPGIVALQIIKFCAKAFLYMARAGVTAFFFGTERDIRRYRDPLMDIIAENPQNSMAFVRKVMFIASVSSTASAIPCSVYLGRHWTNCESCDKPLRWWLLITCIIALTQLPLRIVFSLRLRHLARQRIDVMTSGVHFLTSSRAWCISKSLSLISYAWFVLGVFWTLTTQSCPRSPVLLHACISVIVLSFIRLFLTLGSFYYYFPGPPPGRSWGNVGNEQPFFSSLRPLPLDKRKIEALPSENYKGKLPRKDDSPVSNTPDICSICLTEFELSEHIRRLPICRHAFHVPCIDKWLMNRGTCPLCQRPLS
eukprot:Blabericola_migrator_1__6545@NODE_32_length_18281_cov_109_908422_g28_i0_p8_GENE_NODE_32_length_18281_cov_109_908422_g28_i0NODE_32_length_18281_cov_109_908422_g28_i0_p8_ORF_typecomplete_len330_score25_16zfRING_2/PF13639_6/4_6e03zfRING_2/PF13639_6/4_2e14zfRING_11/PF17123_5/4_2e08zfrbx1/PF12678_7/3_6e03zfrbx1/PF12678_7/2_3e08zfC3HC4/PF00097_25/7_2e07zfC3HC4_2/PF13923_6/3_6e07zfC3HC4_3/PF13920_6/4_6e02zfC3HC4_3/PF13920_6/2_3e05zfANAPC11/PF12861_7/3_7e05zfRING_5/PF14634_6/5_1e03zfRING_5/PF14634_6/4_9